MFWIGSNLLTTFVVTLVRIDLVCFKNSVFDLIIRPLSADIVRRSIYIFL